MRFRRRQPFDGQKSLLRAAEGLYARSNWVEKEFLEWLPLWSPRFLRNAAAQLTGDARVEMVQVLRLDIMKDLLVSERNNLETKSTETATRLHVGMREIFHTGTEIEEPHIFVEFLAKTTVRAAIRTMSDFGSVEAGEVLALGVETMTVLMMFAEQGPNLNTAKLSSSGASAGMSNKYDSLTRPHLLVGELVLNAGASYLPADGSSGDGTFVVTDMRLLFIFDEEFRKTPISISRQDMSAVEFRPTDVVPMSEELYLAFSNFGKTEILAIFVGRFFAAEIRNLLS